MSDDVPAADQSTRRFPLPSPGMTACVTLVVILAGVTLSVWWPYHCEQRVLEEVDALPGIHAHAGYRYIGPRLFEEYADRSWMRWFGRIEELKITDSRPGMPPPSTSVGPSVTRIPNLKLLRRCTTLKLYRVPLQDRDCLKGAVACDGLRVVEFGGCQLERESLHGLDEHAGIVEIVMTSCSVDGEVLELPNLPSLRSFRGNHAWFRQLDVSQTPNLRRVEAKNCSFSDEGVRMLLEAPHLEVLMFTYGRLTDAAIDDLVQLRSIRFLDFRWNPRLTREGVERLADLPRLTSVNVYGTGAADPDLNDLQKVLPQAQSSRYQL